MTLQGDLADANTDQVAVRVDAAADEDGVLLPTFDSRAADAARLRSLLRFCRCNSLAASAFCSFATSSANAAGSSRSRASRSRCLASLRASIARRVPSAIFRRVSSECFLPRFHGVRPLFAAEILARDSALWSLLPGLTAGVASGCAGWIDSTSSASNAKLEGT